MASYTFWRLVQGLVILKLVLVCVFLLLHLTGDPAAVLAPVDATEQDITRIRRELGLDTPLHVQYARFFAGAIRGNFGRSFEHEQPAFWIVMEHLPATLELTAAAFFFSVAVGIPLGCLAAYKENSLFDRVGIGWAVVAQAVPDFWLALMMIMVFSVFLGALPAFGRGGLAHLVMPAFAASTFQAARLARLMRSEMLEVLRREYILTARSKGLSEKMVLFRHALKNSSIPIVTVLGLDLGILLGGTVIIETVFAWPGVGRLTVQAIYHRDFPVVQTAVFVLAAGFVFINLAVDILYRALDPRIEYR
ncbi:MAG: ABC transporter permease [Candidatus Tectomicrobia bacterium RIFCSPLOWO2_12_FULL_69_37]|nr:MAG: ABC transporter permease [Candidatus Tectomicrobia bacterium RIFCSPLOWO2_12_FULL_69_37]